MLLRICKPIQTNLTEGQITPKLIEGIISDADFEEALILSWK